MKHLSNGIDVIRLRSDNLILDEHDISYKGDRKRFVALSYEDDTEHYQFMYELLY